MPINISDAFVADMEGIYAQHANMWNVYNSSIKALLALSSLPLVLAGIMLQSKQIGDIDFTSLPTALIATLFVTPLLVLVATAVVVHYRLDVLFYARALNRYRKIYHDQWGVQSNGSPPCLAPMPTDPGLPTLHEPRGPMGFVVLATGFVNGLYLASGAWPFLLGGFGFAKAGAASAGILVAYVFIIERFYRWNVRKYPFKGN